MASQADLFPDSDPTPAPHHCHARRCPRKVPPARLFCPYHWNMTPPELQAAVWKTYRRGQEVTKDPSPAYLDAMQAAIDAVARLEGVT